MNPARKRKMVGLLLIISVLAVTVGLVLYALSQNISFFYSPTQVTNGEAPVNHDIRVGGMVVQGSVDRNKQALSVRFQITDYANTVAINYIGILPDLFREGQGIVAKGKLNKNGEIKADEVFAKHDENYMPPEVRDTLAKQ